jgi:MshEN domain
MGVAMNQGTNTETHQYPKLSQAMAHTGAKFPEFLATNFARILQQVELFWGTRKASHYLDGLLLDDREGRQGFPLEALQEVALIRQTHDLLYPKLDTNPFDPFVNAEALSSRAPQAPNLDNAIEFEIPAAHEAKTTGNGESAVPSARPSQTPDEQAAGQRAGSVLDKWPKIASQLNLSKDADLQRRGESIYGMQGRPIGEILAHYGLLDEKTLRVVRHMQNRGERQDQPLGQILVEIGIIGHDDLQCALCIQTGIIMVDVLTISIPPEVLSLVSGDKARKKEAIPVGIHNGTLFLAVSDPFAFGEKKSFFTVLTGLNVAPAYAPQHEIMGRLSTYN